MIRRLPSLALLAACAAAQTDPTHEPPDLAPATDLATVDSSTAADLAPACGAVGQPCCNGTCATGAYCYMTTCLAKPTITVMAPDGTANGAVCSDLDVAHVGGAYFQRVVIHGRPGATSYRYYRKVSCNGSMPALVPDGMQPLDASGDYVFEIQNAMADPSCTNGNLGVYDEWAVVDGVESDHVPSRVFSSGCPMYSTCASVSGACP